jgi:HAMP domain-containing protein
MLLVPGYGYLAAAVITVATEAVLFLVLSKPVRQHVGPIGWISLMIRPFGAACAMAAMELVARPLGPLPAVALAIAAYVVALVILRVIGQREVGIARALLGRPDPIAL